MEYTYNHGCIYRSRSSAKPREAAEMVDNGIKPIPGVHTVEIREPVSYARHRYDLVYIT